MKTLLAGLIVLLASVVSTNSYAEDKGCIAVTKEKLCIQLEWTEGPFLGAYSKNVVKFKDLKTSTSDVSVYKDPTGSIQFFGWMKMSGHEHGTRPLITKILKTGVYENSKIFYMGGMMGSWLFKVKWSSINT